LVERTEAPYPLHPLLGLDWWWLLAASIVEDSVRAKLHWLDPIPLSVVGLWFFVQAGWLKRADQSSTALYWYTGAFLAQLFLYPVHWFGVYPRVGDFLEAGAAVLWVVGVFVFRRDMVRHFNGKDDVGLGLTAPMTLFFSILYFQYHFHEIAAFKRRNAETITPVAG